jgi:hypothetical protein
MTRVGAWVRAQRVFGWGKGAVSDQGDIGSKSLRYQVGYMEQALQDEEKQQFIAVGIGSSWRDAYCAALVTVEEWKEAGWWPRR